MAPMESSSIVRLSTGAVAPADRLGYASWILNSSLAPSVLSTGTPATYELEVTALALPSIGIVAASGSPTRSIRGPSEIRRTSQRYFSLALVLSGTANFTSVTRNRFAPGDLIFYDSRNPQDCELLPRWSTLVLQLSEQFVRKWVPNPAVLGSRRICPESQWGGVLASYVAQLAPEFFVQAPLPQAMLIDQLGALLALTAAELSGRHVASTPVERSVRDRVRDHVKQRCPDSSRARPTSRAGSTSPRERCIERWRRVGRPSGRC